MSDKNLKVILTIGPPGSGKSTWTRKFLEKNPNYVSVSRDSFRYMLRDQGFCENKIEKLIGELVNETVIKSLCKKLNVIVDNTHVKESYINDMINLVECYADVEFMPFDVPKEVCIQRDAAREKKVGVEVIERMFKDYEILKQTFHWNPVKKKKNRPVVVPDFDSDLPKAVLFDIDGTLAHMGNRSPYEWNKVDLDSLNDIVAEQVAFHKTKGRTIIILSGRDGVCRQLTEDWLAKHGIEYDRFFMRKENDSRKDNIIKKEIYENQIKDKYNVLCVYDDRNQVVKEWYKLGLFCFNVNQGMLEF